MKVLRIVLKGGGNIDIPLQERFDFALWVANVMATRSILNQEVFIPYDSINFVLIAEISQGTTN